MSTPVEKVPNPFANAPIVATPQGAGVAALMAREAQNISIQMLMARQFPRDVVKAVDRMLNEFTNPQLCEEAEYAYSRGGTEIKGLSIRALEVIGRNWGNLRCGSVELQRLTGRSEMLAYAQDLETGFTDERQFSTAHVRETKKGNYPVTGDRDIYEVTMNQAQRRKRACMEACIPAHVKSAVENQIAVTLKTTAEVTPEVIKKLLERFGEFGVTKEQIEKRIQRTLESMLPAQLIKLRQIYNSLRDQMSEVKDWFEPVVELTNVSSAPSDTSSAGVRPTGTDASTVSEGAATPSTHTEAIKEQIRNRGKKTSEPATGRIPFYNQEVAIKELRSAKTTQELEAYKRAIWEDFKGRQMPIEIEATYHEVRETLAEDEARRTE